ncbi:ferric reductase, putative [Bodo saltans]|uniref:Ferric reductase, putative n=1 Tax=Bodo saltans TaxID=75058 RepID=A0A0S4J8H9_BODSA|nr:ferric reductase, putative [Bodo saltans]|eukprot:CUG86525.1 ferric reductase, putative [Bodo saltans]
MSRQSTEIPLVRRSSAGSRAALLSEQQQHFQQEPVAVGAKPFFWTLVGTASLGIACILASLVGLVIFGEADYFHDPGPYAQNTWHGYDRRTFFGLLAFTVCPTIGFTLLYVALETAQRVQAKVSVTLVYVFFAAAFLNIGAAGMVWGNETMKCFGIFCVGMQKYVEIPNARPEAGIGFLATIGISAFASLVPVGLSMMYIAVRRFRSSSSKHGANHQPSDMTLALVHPTSSTALAGLVFLALNVLFAFTTLYIPNSWEYFTAARIAKNAQKMLCCSLRLMAPRVTTTTHNTHALKSHGRLCSPSKSKQVRILNLKFYPSNVIFFAYVFGVIVFTVIVRMNRQGRLFIKKNVLGSAFTVGELMLGVLTVAMVAGFFIYWIHDHNYNGYWSSQPQAITPSERWARTTGQIAVVFMSLLFFPASRNSVVHKIFGTSWEASLWAHRVLGYCMLAATFAHMVAWWRFFDISGFFPQSIFEVPMSVPTSIDNFTVPLSILAAWLLFLCMGVFALEPVRRRFFELFYYSHIAAAYFAIPVVLWHAAAGWEYLLPGVTVWFVDRITRMLRSGSPVQLVDVTVYRDVTELRFRQPSMTAQAGQYVFINIPEVALYEWHPFTLSTGAHSNEFTLHIKSMGPGTWTQRLHQLAVSGHGDVSLAVDGPYGAPFVAEDYRRVVLVAGGIGITPCASIYSFVKHHHTCSAALLWALREEEVAAAFTNHLSQHSPNNKQKESSYSDQLPATPGQNNSYAKVFLTRASGGESTATVLAELTGVDVFLSRPSYDRDITSAALGFDPCDVLVFVCGPEAMVADVRAIALREGFHFHRETFLL